MNKNDKFHCAEFDVNAHAISDEELDAVSGGASDTAYLDESNLPGGWVVTCTKCGLQFTVHKNKDCPSCANTEVYMGYSTDKPIFESADW